MVNWIRSHRWTQHDINPRGDINGAFRANAIWPELFLVCLQPTVARGANVRILPDSGDSRSFWL